jgi:hypothetical protein
VDHERRKRWGLLLAAAGLPMLEALLIELFGPPSARALAPQASALGPFGVFHDLRWLLVYHSSWVLFLIELTAAIVVRGALIGFFVRTAWPDDQRRPSARRMYGRSILFTAVAAVLLMPWAIIMFAQAVIPISWFFFGAIPPFVIIAMLIHHASVGRWLRRPPLRVVGLVLLSFFVLSLGGAGVQLLSSRAAVVFAGVLGLFNAWAWHATVGGVVVRRTARRSILVPAVLVAFLAVVVGGSAAGFAAKAPRLTGRAPVPDTATTGKPVLIVKGFGGSYAGGKTYSFGTEFLARRYSYAGIDGGLRPLPYEPADTAQPMSVLVQRMNAQVRALNTATRQPVSIVAESEGSLVAERYLETHSAAPVDELIVLSPILRPGTVYYPPAGREGWGVAAGWGLRGLASVMSAVSPLHFEADSPIVRDVVDEPYAYSCLSSRVARIEFLPLADALAARADGKSRTATTVVTAFHGGLLGDKSVRKSIRKILLKDPTAGNHSLRTLDTVVWASAGAWRVPALRPSLNPAWSSSSCP